MLPFGHANDDPTRPQRKVAAVLDPLGLPRVTTVLPGNAADDPAYIPAIRSARRSVGTGGRMYVGGRKTAALGTRAFVRGRGADS
ncbi:MAG TPA: hypothetical protein VH092_24825 [Urbifossiella sp.]|nr:hypothetical protein [Urbifossiella sp.]